MDTVKTYLPRQLRCFVAPQIEQLALHMKPLHCGIYGTVPESLGKGFLWTAALGDDCLVSLHKIKLHESLNLVEMPNEYSCICSASAATVLSAPELAGTPQFAQENLFTFSRPAETTSCLLDEGKEYQSVSISVTPQFFQKLLKQFPQDFDTVIEGMNTLAPQELPHELRVLLRSFSPERANQPGATAYFQGKTLEAMGILAETLSSPSFKQSPSPHDLMQPDASAELTQQAKDYIQQHLDETLTAETVAKNLFVSRTKLYQAFQQSGHRGIGEYIRKARIRKACQLLHSTTASITEIAHQVGYAHVAGFSEAFHKEMNMTPSSWRSLHR